MFVCVFSIGRKRGKNIFIIFFRAAKAVRAAEARGQGFFEEAREGISEAFQYVDLLVKTRNCRAPRTCVDEEKVRTL